MSDDLRPREELGEFVKAMSKGWKILAGGKAPLVGGTVTVSTIYATSTNIIMYSVTTLGGAAGLLSLGTITSGVSFVINSANVLDTSTVGWIIFGPI